MPMLETYLLNYWMGGRGGGERRGGEVGGGDDNHRLYQVE